MSRACALACSDVAMGAIEANMAQDIAADLQQDFVNDALHVG